MPAALVRLFSTQDAPIPSINVDEREQELKKTLGILSKPALSVTELEKQLLHPPSSSATAFEATTDNHVDNLITTLPTMPKVCIAYRDAQRPYSSPV